MKISPHIASRQAVDRRHFLRGTGGIILGLPLLEAMTPAFQSRADEKTQSPKRFVAACAGLGFHGPFLFPENEGKDYTETPYLSLLEKHRGRFTLFSGMSHPEQSGNNGHASGLTWLTSAKRPGLAGFKNTISLDQRIASEVGIKTRFPFLALGSNNGTSLSWTSNGVPIPGLASPSRLFRAMFINGSEKEVIEEVRRFRIGRSILDTVNEEAKRFSRDLGPRDREKLEEYLTSVRDLESRLLVSEGWSTRPKPAIEAQEPKDIADASDAINRQRLIYDMIVLALQSDSTRTITFSIDGLNQVPANIPGVKSDWHNLSHHGRDEAKIGELKLIEEAELGAFSDFLAKLASIREQDRTLLDHTAVLFGSNLGNASSHDWHNLPIILAGGGYQHGGYVAHNAKDNTPLANLFVLLAQRMGVEIDRFGSSTATTVRGIS